VSNSDKAKLQIGKAKAALILERPFIAALAINMPWVEDASIPTMATNGKRFLYNPDFVMSMSLDETKFVIGHEVYHCVFQHMYRCGARDHKRFNQAGDYIINGVLVDDRVGQMPKGGLYDPALVTQAGGTTDGVYNLLPEGGPDGNGHGDPLDDCEDAEGSEAEKAADAADMKVRVAQAAQAAKMCGKLSAHEARLVGQALKPKISWEDVLRQFVASKAKTEYSYARPRRRVIDEDLILPSLSGLQLGKLVVAIDCSGSINAETLGKFSREIKAIHEDCSPEQLTTVYFDSSVSHHDTFEREDTVHIEMHGGGGTAFSPIFEYIENLGVDPVACVVLTDLCCSDFGPEPGYPVLWVSTDDGTAPWGDVVLMDPNQ
jgi:predicted metal-dependent peptidase